MKRVLVGFLFALACVQVQAEEQKFSDLVGSVTVKTVADSKPINVPYITWGGDLAAFYANGDSLRTKPASIYGKLGLDLSFSNGDNFPQQVRDYLGGKTPFVRGTFAMLGQASEVLNKSPETKPVVFLRLTWSLGDHIVSREGIKNISDLKGKTITLQRGGPHVGLVDKTLHAANLNWSDVTVVWVNDITGPNGPADTFRKNQKVDACCVITPDMIGLTSGLEAVGSGGEGTIKGAHVVNSTSTMSRAIADVWAVRSDYYKSHRDLVDKFTAGYLRGTEELVKMRNAYQEGDSKGSFTKGTGPEYKKILLFAQQIFGKEFLPTLEEDCHGLLLDAEFAGLPGQISFFEDDGNLNNFDGELKSALDLATKEGYASIRAGFDSPRLDYKAIAKLAGVEYKRPATSGRINAESLDLSPDSDFGDKTIYSFTINFDVNQTTFNPDQYGAEFRRALEQASTFGNAVVLIRGHADTNAILAHLVRAGMKKGVVKRSGEETNRQYFLNGKTLDLSQTKTLVKLIESGAFDGDNEYNPRELMQSALSLSQTRAENVKRAVIQYSKENKITLDESQIQPLGVGINDPLIPRPSGPEQSKKNMRVEFNIIRIPAESVKLDDYQF